MVISSSMLHHVKHKPLVTRKTPGLHSHETVLLGSLDDGSVTIHDTLLPAATTEELVSVGFFFDYWGTILLTVADSSRSATSVPHTEAVLQCAECHSHRLVTSTVTITVVIALLIVVISVPIPTSY